MARFYFKKSVDGIFGESQPRDCENVEAARHAALELAVEMLFAEPLWTQELRVQVARDDGIILFTIILTGFEDPFGNLTRRSG
jgi:hypothetical protein